MDGLTQLLQGAASFELNANFVCNLMVFCIAFEAISVIVSHLASVGR